MIITIPGLWNCECRANYIHGREELACDQCGAHHDDQPESRLIECMENDWYLNLEDDSDMDGVKAQIVQLIWAHEMHVNGLHRINGGDVEVAGLEMDEGGGDGMSIYADITICTEGERHTYLQNEFGSLFFRNAEGRAPAWLEILQDRDRLFGSKEMPR